MGLYSRYLGMTRPMWWIITGTGTDWQANLNTGDPTLVTDLANATKASDTTIRSLAAWKAQNS